MSYQRVSGLKTGIITGDIMNTTHFNGWDWSELAKAWNVYIPESYAGKDMYAYAEKHRLNPDMDKDRTYTVVEDDGTRRVEKWTDLFGGAEHWAVNDYEDFNEHDPLLWYINGALKGYDGQKDTRVMKKMANDIRAFCRALVDQNHTYMTPVWKGLSEVENDWSLITFIIMDSPILPAMWD